MGGDEGNLFKFYQHATEYVRPGTSVTIEFSLTDGISFIRTADLQGPEQLPKLFIMRDRDGRVWSGSAWVDSWVPVDVPMTEADPIHLPGVFQYVLPAGTGNDSVPDSYRWSADHSANYWIVNRGKFSTRALPADLMQINGERTDGNHAVLKLKQLHILTDQGDAIHAESTQPNVGCGMLLSGPNNGLGVVGGIAATSSQQPALALHGSNPEVPVVDIRPLGDSTQPTIYILGSGGYPVAMFGPGVAYDVSARLLDGNAIKAMLGTWGGHQAYNNLLGAFAALFSKDAPVPTCIASGSYDPATDSLEAHQDAAGSDPWTKPLPGAYPAGSAGAILGAVSGTKITVQSPVASNGLLRLVQGDSYDDGCLAITLDWHGPDLNGADGVQLLLAPRDHYRASNGLPPVTVNCSMQIAGHSVTVTIPITDELSALFEGTTSDSTPNYVYQIVATKGGRRHSLALGSAIVRKKVG